MGKDIRLLKGKDNTVRAVELRTHDKAGKSISIKRPIQHLYPLEIPRDVQEEFEEHSVEEHSVEEHSVEEHSVEEHSVEEHLVEEHLVEEHINEEPNITLIQDKDVLQRIV